MFLLIIVTELYQPVLFSDVCYYVLDPIWVYLAGNYEL